MKKSELRKIIKEEIQLIAEAQDPKVGDHVHFKIIIDRAGSSWHNEHEGIVKKVKPGGKYVIKTDKKIRIPGEWVDTVVVDRKNIMSTWQESKNIKEDNHIFEASHLFKLSGSNLSAKFDGSEYWYVPKGNTKYRPSFNQKLIKSFLRMKDGVPKKYKDAASNPIIVKKNGEEYTITTHDKDDINVVLKK